MTNVTKRRLPWVLMALGALMLLGALAMLSRTPDALQYCVTAPDPGEKGESYAKLAETANRIAGEMKEALAWTAMGGTAESVSLSANGNTEEAALTAMGEGWLEVYPRFVVEGRRIGESEIAEGARVVMLDADLAFSLFGETLPENAAVTLNGTDFRVLGTVRHAGSLRGGRGVGDAQPFDIYMPLLAAAEAGIDLDTLTLSALPHGGSGAAQLFEDAARTRWLDGGELINLKKEAMRRTILPRAVLLIVGMYALVGLFKRMTRLAARWAEGFRQALKGSYMTALLPRLAGLIAMGLLGYGALIGATYLLLVFSAQPLYVFTEWVPENIVEWSSITKVFWSLTGNAARLVRVGTRELRTIEFWGGFVRWGSVLALLGAALLPKARNRKEE